MRLRPRRGWLLRRIPPALAGNPFEVFIAGLCVIAGAPLVFAQPSPASIEAALPHVLAFAWGIELLVGGLITLVGTLGALDRNGVVRVTFRLVERAGLILLGTAAGAYALTIAAVIGSRAAPTVAITGGFALACVLRSAIIADVIRVRRALDEGALGAFVERLNLDPELVPEELRGRDGAP